MWLAQLGAHAREARSALMLKLALGPINWVGIRTVATAQRGRGSRS
jgi:hypothetical protein